MAAPLVLAAVALYHAVLGTQRTMRRRRFGTSVLEIEGSGAARLGQQMRDRMKAGTPLHPTGDYRLALLCRDTHAFHNPGSPASSRNREGHPFRFALPDSVGNDLAPEPAPKPPPNPYVRFRASINIPFMPGRVMTRWGIMRRSRRCP